MTVKILQLGGLFGFDPNYRPPEHVFPGDSKPLQGRPVCGSFVSVVAGAESLLSRCPRVKTEQPLPKASIRVSIQPEMQGNFPPKGAYRFPVDKVWDLVSHLGQEKPVPSYLTTVRGEYNLLFLRLVKDAIVVFPQVEGSGFISAWHVTTWSGMELRPSTVSVPISA